MLKGIIRNVLVSLEVDEKIIEDQTESLATDIKNLAKKLFFEGKINDLKNFIFDIESEKNLEIEKQFIENIDFIKGDEFILEMKKRIQAEIVKTDREKNIESLLEVLDYGHLKGFLSIFKL
jgi:hypothetical protein